MTDVNRMADPIRPETPDRVNLMDQEVQECPYHAYHVLREEAPVWRDPVTGYYVLTRYDDLRKILLNTKVFSSSGAGGAFVGNERNLRMAQAYADKNGFVPAPTMGSRDNPDHRGVREVFDKAFRAKKIKELEPYVESLAYQLIDAFIDDGGCEWVSQFAMPLPLYVIGRQTGAKEEDLMRIKAWTGAYMQGLSMMQSTDEEKLWSIGKEVEMQHYFQPIIEQLRKEPDGSLMSDMINTVIPEWGRTLNDHELHAEIMGDVFVGGAETTANALAAGLMLLAHNRDAWEKLKSDPDKYLRTFTEEVLRLEGPVQGLFRVAAVDFEMHGVSIPKGAVVNPRYAAANRDDRHFECPDKLDLERDNAASHLAFGSGIHHCPGAPLARRELYWGFKAFIDRIDDFWLPEGKNTFRHEPSFIVRSLKELHIEFTPKARSD